MTCSIFFNHKFSRKSNPKSNSKIMKNVCCSSTVLLGLVVLKLNVEAILNANLHFNGGVEFGVSAQCVDHDVQLLGDVIESSDHRGTKEISVNAQEGTENGSFSLFIQSSGDKVW